MKLLPLFLGLTATALASNIPRTPEKSPLPATTSLSSKTSTEFSTSFVDTDTSTPSNPLVAREKCRKHGHKCDINYSNCCPGLYCEPRPHRAHGKCWPGDPDDHKDDGDLKAAAPRRALDYQQLEAEAAPPLLSPEHSKPSNSILGRQQSNCPKEFEPCSADNLCCGDLSCIGDKIGRHKCYPDPFYHECAKLSEDCTAHENACCPGMLCHQEDKTKPFLCVPPSVVNGPKPSTKPEAHLERCLEVGTKCTSENCCEGMICYKNNGDAHSKCTPYLSARSNDLPISKISAPEEAEPSATLEPSTTKTGLFSLFSRQNAKCIKKGKKCDGDTKVCCPGLYCLLGDGPKDKDTKCYEAGPQGPPEVPDDPPKEPPAPSSSSATKIGRFFPLSIFDRDEKRKCKKEKKKCSREKPCCEGLECIQEDDSKKHGKCTPAAPEEPSPPDEEEPPQPSILNRRDTASLTRISPPSSTMTEVMPTIPRLSSRYFICENYQDECDNHHDKCCTGLTCENIGAKHKKGLCEINKENPPQTRVPPEEKETGDASV